MKSFDFWWRLLRPHTLTASFVPVLVGTAYGAAAAGSARLALAAAMLLASALIQVATNLFNEYYDYVRGLDTANSVGISGTIVHDGASPAFVMGSALTCYGLAALLGLYICLHSTWWLAAIGAFCMLIGYLYTGGPWPISASPFGELFAGGFLGTGVICISYYLQTGYVTVDCVLISLPILVLIGLILTANNLRDRVGDAANGRRTLAILLGHRRCVSFMAIMFASCYLWTVLLILLWGQSPWLLLCCLSIPKARQVILTFSPENQTPKQMMPAMKYTAQTNSLFGFCYALGIVLSIFL